MLSKVKPLLIATSIVLLVGLSSYLLARPALSSADSSTPAANVAPASDEDTQGDPNPAYAKIDIHTGVWNEGNAAFWDLPIIDYYKIFGPEERASGYRPKQPVYFSHLTHVQKNQMECQYCHWSVAKAAYAAIPEVQTCIGCHGPIVPGAPPRIGGSTDFQKGEITKLNKYWQDGKPIEWTKVHVMPDFVRFNHKRHVKAGVSCQSCHGQIPKMSVVERVSSMKMGWCISCHRQKGVSIDCYTCHH